jgi:hypothetical protein
MGDVAGSVGIRAAPAWRTHRRTSQRGAGSSSPATTVVSRYLRHGRRRVRKGVDLKPVYSSGYQCTVLNDNTVRLSGIVIDIACAGPQQRSYAHARVEVRQLLDGSWRAYHRDQLIATVHFKADIFTDPLTRTFFH